MKPIWRVLVLIVGLVVLLAGFVMLVTPGPGIAVLLLGLTILATEFRWARYWLVTLKRRALAAARRLRNRKRGQKGPGGASDERGSGEASAALLASKPAPGTAGASSPGTATRGQEKGRPG
jgi:hypothetical protein